MGLQKKIIWVLVAGVVLLPCAWFARRTWFRLYQEKIIRETTKLNQEAFAATYRERAQQVPADGPREGYLGARLGKTKLDPELGWILPPLAITGKLEIDERGMQYCRLPGAELKVLIVGASVAFGAYASDIQHTYFELLGASLNAKGHPTEIGVLAAGAWKSSQEVKALRKYGLAYRPDIVLLLTGLNDLLNGSRADTLYGEKTKTRDGSTWSYLYHEHDFKARVELFLANMREAKRLAAPAKVIFALQPALTEKARLSPTEKVLEANSLHYYGSKAEIQASLEAMRTGLKVLASDDATAFVDCSRAFDSEEISTFTDMWHFSDAGHQLLAQLLTSKLVPVFDSWYPSADKIRQRTGGRGTTDGG
jgi:lysophospholipase L1-like esterase